MKILGRIGNYVSQTTPIAENILRERLFLNAKSTLEQDGRLELIDRIRYKFNEPHCFVNPDFGDPIDGFISEWEVDITDEKAQQKAA